MHKEYSIIDFAEHMDVSPDELKHLFRTFIDEFESELETLLSACNTKDLGRMQGIAHNIKGIAANMEMDSLFIRCKDLNDALKTADDSLDYLKMIDDIITSFAQIKHSLNEFYGNMNS